MFALLQSKETHSVRLSRIPGKAWLLAAGVTRRLLRSIIRPLFAECGHDVQINPHNHYPYETTRLGNYVSIRWASGHCLVGREGFFIGDKVAIGPKVSIRSGCECTPMIVSHMAALHDQHPEDGHPVVIERDVWIGAGALIANGATISRGAIIGAGAVITEDVPAYAVVVGSPARVLRFRWTVEETLEHERALYPAHSRLSEEFLRRIQAGDQSQVHVQ